MANIEGKFKDCPVIVYDGNNNYITKTVIESHNNRALSIEVSDKLDEVELGARLNLLVLHSGGASEFSGVAKCMFNGLREITLSDEKKRQARVSVRHKLDAPAVITKITTGAEQKQLNDPIHVTIENISSSGMLVKTPLVNFAINAILELNTSINGKDIILMGRLVRKQVYGDNTIGVGCKLVFLK